MNDLPAKTSPVFWVVVVVAAVACLSATAVGLVIWLNDEPSTARQESSATPPSALPPPPTGDIKAQVHEFCGKCHAYPPPDTFPRSAWREEVEQGFRFFGLSNLAMRPPLIDDVALVMLDRACAAIAELGTLEIIDREIA